jgi:hypothetical protein
MKSFLLSLSSDSITNSHEASRQKLPTIQSIFPPSQKLPSSSTQKNFNPVQLSHLISTATQHPLKPPVNLKLTAFNPDGFSARFPTQ